MHGIAINVAVDPTHWQRVRPCGLDPEVMSDLRTSAKASLTMDDVRAVARQQVFLLTVDADPV